MLRLSDYAQAVLPTRHRKTSQYHRVDMGESVSSWGQKAGEALRRQHPWTAKYDVRVEITASDDTSNAVGYFFLLPKQVPPTALGRDKLPAVRVPIIISDKKLLPLDTYIYEELFLPLTEDRVRAILSTGDIFMPVTARETEQLRDSEMGINHLSTSPGFGGAGGSMLGHAIKAASVSMETARRLGMDDMLSWSRQQPGKVLTEQALSSEFASNPWVQTQLKTKTSQEAKAPALDPGDSLDLWLRSASQADRLQPLLSKVSQLRGHEIRRTESSQTLEYRPIWSVSPEDGRPGYGPWRKTSSAHLADVLGEQALARALPVVAEMGHTVVPRVEHDNGTPVCDLSREVQRRRQDGDMWDKLSSHALRPEDIRPDDLVLYEEQIGHDTSRYFVGAKISQILGADISVEHVLDATHSVPTFRPAAGPLRPMVRAGKLDKTSGARLPAGFMLGHHQETGDLTVVVLSGSTTVKTSEGTTAHWKNGLGTATLTSTNSAVVRSGDWTFRLLDVYDPAPADAAKVSAAAQRYAETSTAMAYAKASAELIRDVDSGLLYLQYDSGSGTFTFDSRTPTEYLASGFIKGSSAPQAVATLLCMGMGARDALESVKLASEEGRALYRISEDAKHAQALLQRGDASLRAVATAAEQALSKMSAYRGGPSEAAIEALAVVATRPDSVLAKTSTSGSGTSLDVLLSLDFLNRDTILKFTNFLPVIEQCQGYLCALRIASRLGLDEISDTACTSAIDSMEPIIFGLRSIRHVLRN